MGSIESIKSFYTIAFKMKLNQVSHSKTKHLYKNSDGWDTHGEEEVHDAGIQKCFPPAFRRLERDVLRGLKHGDVVAPQ